MSFIKFGAIFFGHFLIHLSVCQWESFLFSFCFFSSDAEQKNREEALKWIVSLDFKIINHHAQATKHLDVVYAEEVFNLIFWWEIVFLEWQIIMGRCMRSTRCLPELLFSYYDLMFKWTCEMPPPTCDKQINILQLSCI